MHITFLGTSAANAFPEAFCKCHNCVQARALGGKSLRRRSAVLINDDLLIDLGPDIMSASHSLGCPLTQVRYCLQTHAHADHLDPSHLLSRSPGYGVVGAPRLHFFASSATLQRAAQSLGQDTAPYSLLDAQAQADLNLAIHPVEPFETFAAGPYQVTSFPATHDPTVQPLLFAVEGGGRAVFYGTDTAELSDETWEGFHRLKMVFDLVILDHTYGVDEESSDHLCARDVARHVARMREEGLLAQGGRALATHIAHEGNPAYPELAEYAVRHGYEVAYDGLIVHST
jgi:phosphoribosyl 1,2-cyclic phosphate phosphodiesterase